MGQMFSIHSKYNNHISGGVEVYIQVTEKNYCGVLMYLLEVHIIST